MHLSELNALPSHQRKAELQKCCGATAWVEKMDALFPFVDKESLFQKADAVWKTLNHEDWLEAFSHHPKIGDIKSLKKKFASTARWAAGEQSTIQAARPEILEELGEGNKAYEDKFGYIFIVCATGKSAEEMLVLLQERLSNSTEEEIGIAAAEQAKITKIRLEKLVG